MKIEDIKEIIIVKLYIIIVNYNMNTQLYNFLIKCEIS